MQLLYFSRKGFSGSADCLMARDPAGAETPIPLGLNHSLWEPPNWFRPPQFSLLTTAGQASDAAWKALPPLATLFTGPLLLLPGARLSRSPHLPNAGLFLPRQTLSPSGHLLSVPLVHEHIFLLIRNSRSCFSSGHENKSLCYEQKIPSKKRKLKITHNLSIMW